MISIAPIRIHAKKAIPFGFGHKTEDKYITFRPRYFTSQGLNMFWITANLDLPSRHQWNYIHRNENFNHTDSCAKAISLYQSKKTCISSAYHFSSISKNTCVRKEGKKVFYCYLIHHLRLHNNYLHYVSSIFQNQWYEDQTSIKEA